MLRMKGVIPPSAKASPTFLSLLDELKVDYPKVERHQRITTKSIQLRKSELETISNMYSIETHEINPVAMSQNRIRSHREHHEILWCTEQEDNKRSSSCNHHVCWVSTTQPFRKHVELDDIDDFNFGKVVNILNVDVAGTKTCFFRPVQYKTLCYEVGGVWTTERSSLSRTIVPMSCISEPLLTDTPQDTPNLTHVLNSKVKFSHTEARTFLDHMERRE